MAYEHSEGFGSVFENRDKKQDNHPDFKGDAKFEGKTVEVALWERTDRNGNTYYSLKIQRPRSQQNQEQPPQDRKPRKPVEGDPYGGSERPF